MTPAMIDAYTTLHLGWAHSVEARRDGELRGVYGVAVGGLFAGESMFTRIRDGSKVVLVHLVQRLRERSFRLFDAQIPTTTQPGWGPWKYRAVTTSPDCAMLACKVEFV